MSDDEVETLTYQILKFFDDDPLTPDELTDQVYWAAQWANQAKLNIGMLKMVLDGELVMGFDRVTKQPQFKRLPKSKQNEPAKIADLEDDKEWWE